MAYSKYRILYLVICLVMLPLPAKAGEMSLGKPVNPPFAFIQYCFKNYDECSSKGRANSQIEMSSRLWRDMQEVQAFVNAAIKPRSDIENSGAQDVWDAANNGYGDCEDYAILKKRLMMARGWGAENLLLTTATTEQREKHVVLTVVTSDGDYVLDNRVTAVQPWEKLAYHWIARQEQKNALLWGAINEPAAMASLAY